MHKEKERRRIRKNAEKKSNLSFSFKSISQSKLNGVEEAENVKLNFFFFFLSRNFILFLYCRSRLKRLFLRH